MDLGVYILNKVPSDGPEVEVKQNWGEQCFSGSTEEEQTS